MYLTRDRAAPRWRSCAPEIFAELLADRASCCRNRLREEMQIEFTIENGRLAMLDAVRVQRSARAAVRIAVALAEDGVIGRDEAVMRIEPRALTELLHRQVDPARRARRAVVRGIAASPGAAVGRIVLHLGGRAGQRRARASPASWCAARPRPRTCAACMPRPAC